MGRSRHLPLRVGCSMLGPTMPLDMMTGLAGASAGARRATAHEGFFAVLRDLAEAGQARGLSGAAIEQEPAWRVTMAGVVSMRLVDRWANSRSPAAPAPSLEEIEAVQRAIVACEPGAITNILTGIVLAVTRWWGRRSPVVLTSVLAYARLLDGDDQQQWKLAEDVYSTFLAHAHAGRVRARAERVRATGSRAASSRSPRRCVGGVRDGGGRRDRRGRRLQRAARPHRRRIGRAAARRSARGRDAARRHRHRCARDVESASRVLRDARARAPRAGVCRVRAGAVRVRADVPARGHAVVHR